MSNLSTMQKKEYRFDYEVYDQIDELEPQDRELLNEARAVTAKAYAPYSRFLVGAVSKLKNGATVSGTNQENASYPVGICAERALLSSASMLHTDVPINSMAIAYHNLDGSSDTPVSPCGMCRQALREYEDRTDQKIRLILSGMEGKVFVIPVSSQLLPLSFGGENLK